MIANQPLSKSTALYVRLAVGLVFGVTIGLLLPDDSGAAHLVPWKAAIVGALTLGAFVLWAGAGAMRRLSLLIWGAVALGIIAFISWHQAVHFDDRHYNPFFINQFFLIYPFLFISHELISSADQAGKPVAPFNLYFDEAWKRGIQLALAVAFTGLFWGILFLGSHLLETIGFKWLKWLLDIDYISWPLSGLALASAVHLGDVQTKLLTSARALALGVLCWLLPVIGLIGVIFVGSLAVSGLAPLWKTGAATFSLLSACGLFVLLINAAYQLGDEERKVHIVLKWAVRLSSGLLLILAALAAYSLSLRIGQYGLTPERVLAAVGAAFALFYGVGYTVSVFWPGRWMRGLKAVNIGLAMLKSLVFLALLTPLADPARLSVGSQVARLEKGKITTDRFDWAFLRYESGTYGRDALKRLVSSKVEAIRTATQKASTWKDEDRWEARTERQTITYRPDPQQIKVIFPKAAHVPQSFMATDFTRNEIPCLKGDNGNEICEVALLDMTRDGQDEVLILQGQVLKAYQIDDGKWTLFNTYYSLDNEDITAFREGRISRQPAKIDDLLLGDTILSR
ncbi:DUF4153 domain-containing protein [Asticcacaulis sp. YBE204]|uniref:DUF4153 domain-containing protein n=1 Tax=Asticcacaulis sp. YBE204 TaxID=1282363 RepID=UPI0003C406A1|nr:DUF4153 domain-containing protein [Asticcacaulis sp. YBE204]ESQ78761.1 hypothetical protein AEYBE204_12310 [Asticcacaulis sp. YBE204]